MENNMQVAQTIMHQLGGGQFCAMVGLTAPLALPEGDGIMGGLQFSFKGCKLANKCRIELNWKDYYDVKFYKLNRRTMDCPLVHEDTDIDAESLTGTFTEFTRLYTSL